MRSYDLGDPDLDGRIRQLVADASPNANADLVTEMITTALKLHRDDPARGDLRLINTALKEMRYSMLVFSRHDEPKVTIYGSARTGPGEPNYTLAESFGREMAARGWGVVTGAGPGIMEAGNKGAGSDSSYGVNIRLPFESSANDYLLPDRTVNFKYFFTRKLGFVKESHAFAILPGGFGTLDEMFELLTLVQTGKSDLHPIVMLETEGTGYWASLIPFISSVLVAGGYIAESDLELFSVTSDPEAAAEEICHFYANYHSQRFVDGILVLRLKEAPAPEVLAELNRDFADIIVGQPLTVIEATPAERADDDHLDLDRLSFKYDRRSFGRLRQLIDRLNDLVVTPQQVHPPPPMETSEMAERPW